MKVSYDPFPEGPQLTPKGGSETGWSFRAYICPLAVLLSFQVLVLHFVHS